MDITYGRYLKVPELLSLQQPVGTPVEHDEMLFIVIHQVYELWFRQQIHELAFLQSSLEAGHDVDALRTLKRKLTDRFDLSLDAQHYRRRTDTDVSNYSGTQVTLSALLRF